MPHLYKTMLTACVALSLLCFNAHTQTLSPQPKPTLAVGDTWQYRAFDLLTKNELFKTAFVVKEITDKEFWVYGDITQPANPRVWWQGDSNSNHWAARYEFDASAPRQIGKKLNEGFVPVLRWPLTVGESWKAVQPALFQDGSKGRNEVTVTVEAEEEITVPAGTFKTIKVSSKGFWYNESRGWSGRRELIFWFAPSVKREIKSESRVWTGGGGYFDTTGMELSAYKVGEVKAQ
jgi:hypothetical protein